MSLLVLLLYALLIHQTFTNYDFKYLLTQTVGLSGTAVPHGSLRKLFGVPSDVLVILTHSNASYYDYHHHHHYDYCKMAKAEP
jgi:hypothetical protein